MTSIEAKLNQVVDENSALGRILKQLREALHQERVAHAATHRKYILRDSQLPAPCVKRLEAAFAQSTDNSGLKEAINVELKFLERAR
jgi:hypothetical protein